MLQIAIPIITKREKNKREKTNTREEMNVQQEII